MALAFPSSPTTNQTFTDGTRTWRWNGTAWQVVSAYVLTGDPRLSDSRTPTSHKSSHATGGADALTPADIGAEPAFTSLPINKGGTGATTAAQARINLGITNGVTSYNDLTDLPTLGSAAATESSDYATASHTHGSITNAGAIGTASGVPIITGANGVLQAGQFGMAAGTFCEGNDSRIANASATANIQIFTTTANWTKPASAKSVNIILLGGGGGGGGGGKSTTTTTFRAGGGGGGGGGFLNVTVPASILPSTPIPITIGAGGAGGAGATTNAAGTAGTQGGDTIFGTGVGGTITYISTGGIQGGGGAVSGANPTTGAAGGGTLNAHTGGAGSSTNGAGGAPTSAVAAHMMGGAGGGGGGGLASGASSTSGIGAANTGGRSVILNLTGGTVGNAGTNNANALNGMPGVGSGGGGGNPSLTNGQSGGNGGFPSSGGGGGGAAQDGNAGNGGQGGAGMAIITTYF